MSQSKFDIVLFSNPQTNSEDQGVRDSSFLDNQQDSEVLSKSSENEAKSYQVFTNAQENRAAMVEQKKFTSRVADAFEAKYKSALVVSAVLLLFAVNIALCIALSVEISKLKSEQQNIGTLTSMLERLNSSTDERSQQLLQALDDQTQEVADSSFQHINTSLEILLQSLSAVDSRTQDVNSSVEFLSQQLLQEVDSRMQQVNTSLEMLATQLSKDIAATVDTTEQVSDSLESFMLYVNSSLETLRQDAVETERRMQQDILAVEGRTNATLEALSAQLSQDISTLSQEISTVEGRTSTLEVLSTQLSHDISTVEGRTNATLEALSAELSQDISTLSQEISTVEGRTSTLEVLSTQLSHDILTVEGRTNATLEALSAQLSQDVATLSQEISTVEGRTNATLETRSTQLSQDISTAEGRTQQVNATLEALFTQLSQDISTAESRTNATLEALSTQLSQDILTVEGRTTAALEGLSAQLSQDILTAEGRTNATLEALSTQLSQDVLTLFGELNTSVDSLSQELSADRQSAASEAQQINSSLNTLSKQLEEDVSSISDNIEQLNVTLLALERLVCDPVFGETPQCAASSCDAIFSASLPSGLYWVRTSNGSAARVFCDVTFSCGNITGGWMRVTQQNFSDPNISCPAGFSERFDDDLRTCQADSIGCTSIDYSTSSITYSSVCGQLVGYQFGSPEAFSRGIVITSLTTDSQYLDGWSLTHGDPPRQHIWSFAVGVTESRQDRFGCPCNIGSTVSSPSFVGSDYFCDSAASSIGSRVVYTSNTLWDGVGCAASNECCSFNNPPWFYKELPMSTSDDIELRSCQDESIETESVLAESISIYVR